MANPAKYPDQSTLKSKLHYAPVDDPAKNLKAGDWIWLEDIWHPSGCILVRAGDKAGSLTAAGDIRIGLNGKIFPAHRLAFIYMTGACPSKFVYHIDGDLPLNFHPAAIRASTISVTP